MDQGKGVSWKNETTVPMSHGKLKSQPKLKGVSIKIEIDRRRDVCPVSFPQEFSTGAVDKVWKTFSRPITILGILLFWCSKTN